MTLLLLLICLPMAFVLSGVESALLTISRVRTRHAVEAGDKAAARLLLLLEHRVELLHVVTALNHSFTLLGFVITASRLVIWLGPWGWLVTLLVATPVFLVALELLPKQLFHRYPLGLLRLLTPPLALLLKVARPWLWLGHLFESRVLNDVPEEGDQRSMASLATSIDALGVLRPAVGGMLQQAGRLQKVCSCEAMIPLKNVTALFPEMPLNSALVLCREQNHAWRPVMGTDGTLLGWLDVASLPSRIPADKMVRQFMRPLSQMRTTESALRCLQTLRRRNEPIAAVINEAGEAVGVISQQSLLHIVLGNHTNGHGHGNGHTQGNGNSKLTGTGAGSASGK